MADQPYDPYIPSGNAGAGNAQGQPGNQRTAAIQQVRSPLYHVLVASGCGHDGKFGFGRVAMPLAPFALVGYG